MAIVKMKKATIIALQAEKESLLKSLQAFGGLHMIDIGDVQAEELKDVPKDNANEEAARLEALLSQVKYSLDFLSKYDKSKKPLFPAKTVLTESQYQDYLANLEKAEILYKECRAIDEKFAEIKNMETKLNNLLSQLNIWTGLDIPFEQIGDTLYTSSLIGHIPSRASQEFSEALLNSEKEYYLEPVGEDKESTFYFLVYHRSAEETVQQLLKQFGWTKVNFGELQGTASENILDIQNKLKELEARRAELIQQAEAMLTNKPYLEALFDILNVEKDRKDVVSNFVRTKKSFVILAWVPEPLTKALEDAMKKVTDFYILTLEDPSEEEEIPVLLDNPAIVKPVEMITEQYSLPNPRSLDPNRVMAPFFIMFFGMMVSDAAYGIILSALTAYALYKFKPTGGAKQLFQLLCLGGLATLFWGALFGGWVGGLIPIKPIWFNPTDEPLKMLLFCLAVGVVHLYVGMGLQAYKSIKAGNIKDAIYDQGFWYLFLTGLMLLAVAPSVGKYMAIIGAIGLVLTQGRDNKNIIKRLLSGILSLYNVTSFLGDVLSYSRLLALGLATGVIGTVINEMSLMLSGNIIGIIFMIIFMVVGHTFNIAINVLGAYVHSSRLQYVEFFGKFFEGDGKPYAPFSIKTKYIEQKN